MGNIKPVSKKEQTSCADKAESFSVSEFQTFNTYAGQTPFELKYVSGHPVKYFLSEVDALPSTCAMAWCMRETEMARLFTREDIFEFLFRLQILYQCSGLAECWMTEGYLLPYTYKGKEYRLTLEDVINHFGLEAYDQYINFTPRNYFFARLSSGINFSLKVGYNAPVPELEMEDPRRVETYRLGDLKFTPEVIAGADFIARDMMSNIPEDLFKVKSRTFLEKEKELKLRQERIANIELPGIKKIPQKTLRKCFQTIFRDDFVEQILSDPAKFEADGRKPLYLGWVFANHFMRPDGSMDPEKRTFILDFMDYEIDEGSRFDSGRNNLSYNVDFERMEKMAPLLKGVSIK